MINDPEFSEFSEEFAQALLDFCESPAPGTAFVSGLEQKLLSHQAVLLRTSSPNRYALRRWGRRYAGALARPAWQYAVVIMLIALSVALVAIGPQRVLAQVQQWLGYLPGAGFVNPAQTRVLAAPLEARQGNSLLQVQQVIAGPDQTVVVAMLTGSAQEIDDHTEWAQKVTLILPDGQRLIPMNSTQRGHAGQLQAEIVFVQLPLGVNQVTLVMPKLPTLKGGAQEFWSVILPLVEVSQGSANANGSASPGSLAVAPYTPKNAQVTNQGVTAHLLQVAHSGQETGLLLQVDWSDPTWQYQGTNIELRDNLGRVYPRLERAPGTGPAALRFSRQPTTAQEMIRFAPLDPGVQQLTLTLKAIYFEVQPSQSFRFDPGEHPFLEQTWSFADDPAMRFSIAGLQLQVMQARLTSAPAGSQLQERNSPEATLLPQPTALPTPACRLEFVVEFTSRADAKILSLGGLSLPGGRIQGDSGSYTQENENRSTIYMDLSNIPTTALTIHLTRVTVSLQGGWQFNWELLSPR